ncbi:sigma-54-dependent transcriptional regulator [Anaerocolumna chitinilytica]|uniref:Stage 0 sporulation protein A homolog n=1 Tax=Anaerocolumna chitinilytica TaxID=1727145 RepID=A0A7I8DMC9_9FIRM|nr:acetoacetate metabolism regulatory protein AtoC [Anaerocolumna chitinilytica]
MKILIADDEKNMRWILGKNLREENFDIIEASDGEEAFHLFLDEEPDLVILDYRMPKIDGMEVLKRIKTITPKLPVIMITAHGSTDAAVEAMKLGAADYISKPFDINDLKLSIFKALNIDKLNKEIDYLKETAKQIFNGKIIGNSKKIQDVFDLVNKVANTNASVLIIGESGTGKEGIAASIHNKSSRSSKPFITVNCGAIPETLIESELFGYEKGAFTGANARKAGRFDRAQGGTLFLDEIGELSLPLQVKILRVLQEKEFERVGGSEVIKSDVRIIAATNRDLEQMVEKGDFREDLLYRLKVIPVYLPPLRERKEDIPQLVDYFLDKYSKEVNRTKLTMEKETLDLLRNYDFPGNIRELENLVERLVILSPDPVIEPSLLPKEILKEVFSGKKEDFILPEEGINLEKVEESFVRQALMIAKGNQTNAAKLLGLSRHALIYRIEKFNLK